MLADRGLTSAGLPLRAILPLLLLLRSCILSSPRNAAPPLGPSSLALALPTPAGAAAAGTLASIAFPRPSEAPLPGSSFLAGALPAPAARPFRSVFPAASPAAARFLPELDAATAASGSCFFFRGRSFGCGFGCGNGPCPNKGAGGGAVCGAVLACVFFTRCRCSLSRSTLLMSFALSASSSGDGATSVPPNRAFIAAGAAGAAVASASASGRGAIRNCVCSASSHRARGDRQGCGHRATHNSNLPQLLLIPTWAAHSGPTRYAMRNGTHRSKLETKHGVGE